MKRRGKLIVHTGSMFSGKTTSLRRELFRLRIAKYKVVAFKPDIDNRYDDKKIITHDHKEIDAYKINDLKELLEYKNNHEIDAIGIDEIQFFKNDPAEVIEIFDELIKSNITVVVSGLDMDYKARPFEIIKELMPMADVLEKHHAICANCGEDAWVSFRKTGEEDRIEIGADEIYEPLCRNCYEEKMREREGNKKQIKFI